MIQAMRGNPALLQGEKSIKKILGKNIRKR